MSDDLKIGGNGTSVSQESLQKAPSLTSWISINLSGYSWTAEDYDNIPSSMRDKSGMVFLRGTLAQQGSDVELGMLHISHRPKHNKYLVTYSENAQTNILLIRTDGVIEDISVVGARYMSLNGLSFYAGLN